MKGTGFSPYITFAKSPWALQAAEKVRMDSERAQFGRCKTINQPSRIDPGASWRDPFFAPFGKLSFSAACLAPEGTEIQTDPLPKRRIKVGGFNPCGKTPSGGRPGIYPRCKWHEINAAFRPGGLLFPVPRETKPDQPLRDATPPGRHGCNQFSASESPLTLQLVSAAP